MSQIKILTKLDAKKLAGKNGLVLFFYPKASGDDNDIEVNEFNLHVDDFAVLGVNIAGITLDKQKKNFKFAEAVGIKYPLISDEDKKIVTNAPFNIQNKERTTFFLDKNGNLVHTFRNVKPWVIVDEALDFIGHNEKVARVQAKAINKGVNKAVAKTKAKQAKKPVKKPAKKAAKKSK